MNKRLKAIQDRDKKATPGPWKGHSNIPFYATVDKPAPSFSKHDDERPHYWRIEDAEFVISAREDVPYLLFLIDEITYLFKNHLNTMTYINQDLDYVFTQPLVNTRQALEMLLNKDKISQEVEETK